MGAEYRTPEGISAGYFCLNCGETCNMYATGHFDMRNWRQVCIANPEKVAILKELNK